MKKIIFALFSLFFMAGLAQATPALTTANLNLRTGPGIKFAIQDVISSGTFVDVAYCSEYWCSIKFHNQSGWVAKPFLAFSIETNKNSVNKTNIPVIHPPNNDRSMPELGRYWEDDWYWNQQNKK